MAVGTLEPHFFKRFCDAMGSEFDQHSKEGMAVGEEGEALRRKIQTKLLNKSVDEWLSLFDKYDVPVSRVVAPEVAGDGDQLKERKMTIEVTLSDNSKIKVAAMFSDNTSKAIF